MSDMTIEELHARIAELEAAQTVKQDATPEVSAVSGGEPILYHLHLEDGTVIRNHVGASTHYSDSDGKIRRVTAMYAA